MGKDQFAKPSGEVIRATWIQTVIALLILVGGIVATYSSLNAHVARIEQRFDDADEVRKQMQEQLNRIEQKIIERAP